jgi:hypothetical protein
MNRLTEFQRRANRESAAHWRLSAGHRERVMHLIETNAPAGGRVCVLGAGNCNDLDLPRLLAQFAEVTLVDLDDDALRRAAERQGVAGAASLRVVGGCDLTGVWEVLERLVTSPNDASLLDQAVANSSRTRLSDVGAPFDVVASTCVLSQLVKGVADAVGETHPRFLELLSAVRLGHLHLLSNLAAPGGRVLLVTDFVSSDTAPEIASAPEEQLAELAQRLVEARNFFHGMNPAVLASLWRSDPALAAATGNLQVARPWRWDFGVRVYLTTAIQVARRYSS